MWKRLVDRPAARERISLITSIFSDKDESDVIDGLRGDDAQAFIDAVDEVHPRTLTSQINQPTDSNSNSRIPSFRFQTSPALHQRYGTSASILWARCASAMTCSRVLFWCRFVTTNQISHCTKLGTQTCGWAITKAEKSR